MKKKISTTTGVLELTLEETIDLYQNMVRQFAHRCVKCFSHIDGNVLEYDDYVQTGYMVLMRAYYSYDYATSCFSTYLTKALKNRIYEYTRYFESGVRKSPKIEYLNNVQEDSHEDFFNTTELSSIDEYFSGNKSDLEKFILGSLTVEEKNYLVVEFNKYSRLLNNYDQDSYEYCAELFNCNKDRYLYNVKKQDFSKDIGISRPTLNTRIKQAIEKVQVLIIKFYEDELGGEI